MSSKPKAYVQIAGGNGTRGGAILDTRLIARGWDVTVGFDTTNPLPTAQQLKDQGYVFLGIDASFWGVSPTQLTIAYQAYQLGLNVVTTGNDTSWSAGNPIWTGSVNGTKTLSPVTPATATGHPVSQGWVAHNDTDALTHLTGVRASAVVVGTFGHDTLGEVPAIIAETNPNGNGARYVHSQPYTMPLDLFNSIANWTETPGGMVRYWNGSAWVYKSASVWNGTSWIKRPVKKFNGTAWVNI